MCIEDGIIDEGCKQCKANSAHGFTEGSEIPEGKYKFVNVGATRIGAAFGSVNQIEKRFGAAMHPLKYRAEAGTIILIDKDGGPVGRDNGDGTWSGLKLDLLNV